MILVNKKNATAGNRGAFNHSPMMDGTAQSALLPERKVNMPGRMPFVFSYLCHQFSSLLILGNLILHFAFYCIKHFPLKNIQRPFHSVAGFLSADTREIDHGCTDVLHALAFAIS